MPELPEVETVSRGLAEKLLGLSIGSINIINPKLRIPIPKEITKSQGSTVIDVKRKAKYIVIELNNSYSIIIHLGMSGRVIWNDSKLADFYHKDSDQYQKHDHFEMNFTSGSRLKYNDTRKFGLVTYVESSKINQHKLFGNLGIEPFSDEFNKKNLEAIFSKRNKAIKLVLMDSSLILGIGNIYASEILYRAKVNPMRAAATITSKESILIQKYSLEVLQEAIDAGGSSLRDYVDSDGDLGYFQHRFNVYDREAQACKKCTSLILRIKQAGRSTYYCPSCQS